MLKRIKPIKNDSATRSIICKVTTNANFIKFEEDLLSSVLTFVRSNDSASSKPRAGSANSQVGSTLLFAPENILKLCRHWNNLWNQIGLFLCREQSQKGAVFLLEHNNMCSMYVGNINLKLVFFCMMSCHRQPNEGLSSITGNYLFKWTILPDHTCLSC